MTEYGLNCRTMPGLVSNSSDSTIPTAYDRPAMDTMNVLTVIGCILMTLTVVVILSFNPLNLVVLHRASNISQITKLLILSLTFSDLGTGVFWALPKLSENIAGRWFLGGALCRLHGIGYRTFLSLSVSSVVLLNIDRYIAIVYSLHYCRIVTVKRTVQVLVVVWAVTQTGGIAFYGFAVYRIVSETPPRLCVWNQDGLHGLAFTSVLFASLVVMAALYTHILIIARRQARRVATETHQVRANHFAVGLPVRRRVHIKSATTVFIITGAISLSWIPQIIIGSLAFPLPKEWKILSDTLLMTNSWLNVIIYSFRNKDLKRSLCDIASRLRHFRPF